MPVQGLAAPTPRLLQVLRHELAHSFIAARTGGNCPVWLQEGISQWLEGGDPGREDARLAALARKGALVPLVTLEGPFDSLGATDAGVAYAQSLSVVGHLLRRGGEEGVRRLIEALGRGQTAAEALPTVFSLSYSELQRDWEAHLKSVRGAGL